LGELLFGHFQGEDDAGEVVVGGDGLDHVHSEGGFAHGGSGGDDDHFAVLEAVEHVVEVEEAGFEAALAAVFDHFEDFMEDAFEGDDGAADFFLGDFEDAFFGLIDDEVGLFVWGVGVAEDVVGGGDELAEEEFFTDDAGVVDGVGGGGDGVEDLGEVGDAADFVEELAFGEFLAEDDGVDGSVLFVEFEEDVEDDLVVGLEEGVAIDEGDDVADGLFIEHHGGEEAHFGFEGVGG
jgi:hypothetical protein